MIKQSFFTLTLCLSFATVFGAAIDTEKEKPLTLAHIKGLAPTVPDWKALRRKTPYHALEGYEKTFKNEAPPDYKAVFAGIFRDKTLMVHKRYISIVVYQSKADPMTLSLIGHETDQARQDPATKDFFIAFKNPSLKYPDALRFNLNGNVHYLIGTPDPECTHRTLPSPPLECTTCIVIKKSRDFGTFGTPEPDYTHNTPTSAALRCTDCIIFEKSREVTIANFDTYTDSEDETEKSSK